jgi:outer membrane protein
MKNFNSIALAVIALAVVGLYILHFTGNSSCANDEANAPKAETQSGVVFADTTSTMTTDNVYPIAYVDVQKMQECLQKFDFFKTWNQKLLQKQAKSNKELESAQKKLAAELEVFQQKYQSGGFLTKESFEQEQNRLYKKDQELQSLAMRLEQEFANEQLKLSKQLMDTIDIFFLSYNKEHNFKLILNHADVLFADSTMNITEDVLEQLNERYAKKSDK